MSHLMLDVFCVGRISTNESQIISVKQISSYSRQQDVWLFADTPKGAAINIVLDTLVETARANNLDVYEYFKISFVIIMVRQSRQSGVA